MDSVYSVITVNHVISILTYRVRKREELLVSDLFYMSLSLLSSYFVEVKYEFAVMLL